MDILKDFLINLPFAARIIAYIIGIIVWTWFMFIYPDIKNRPSENQSTTPSINTKIDKVEGDYVARDKNIYYQEIKKPDSIIKTLELRVNIIMSIPQEKNIEEGTSVGLANIVGLFSSDKTRYRFISDYKFSLSRADSDKQKLTLVYTPETVDQIIGKKIDFLKDMKILAINYSDFLKTINLTIDRNQSVTFNIDIILNGIKVTSITDNVLANTICDGQAHMGIGKYFQNIDKVYAEIASK